MQFYHWDSLPDGKKSKAGRKLTKFLRHLPSSSLVNLGQVIFLIDLQFLNHFNLTLEEIFFIVKNDRKHRLALFKKKDNWWIAACQGHSNASQSIDVIEQHLLEPIVDIPPFLWHGTTRANATSIFKSGLSRQSRYHIHLVGPSPENAYEPNRNQISGFRSSSEALIRIDTRGLNIVLWKSLNGVYLTTGNSSGLIPHQFLKIDG